VDARHRAGHDELNGEAVMAGTTLVRVAAKETHAFTSRAQTSSKRVLL